jgi:hypothetical protein
MSIFETFAKRKPKAENAGKPVIYIYDVLPPEFRVQVSYIWRDAIGSPLDFPASYFPNHMQSEKVKWWAWIHDSLAREIGVHDLVPARGSPHIGRQMEQCLRFLHESKEIDQVLSLIELSFRLIDIVICQTVDPREFEDWRISQLPDHAIKELNYRFQEHAIGYQYEGGQIVEVNSQYLHAETVEPAVSLLHDAQFDGPLQEFLQAHKHYRERNNKEAIAEALKAFESTMKTICDKRKWGYSQGDSASKLLTILFDQQLVPSEMQSHFNGLRTTLESGVPTLRNRRAGHGQGSDPTKVPDYLVAYALHLTASNIVFLINAHNTH